MKTFPEVLTVRPILSAAGESPDAGFKIDFEPRAAARGAFLWTD